MSKAEPLFQQALRIREQNLGPDHPDLAPLLNNLALLYRNLGKYEQAVATLPADLAHPGTQPRT